MDKMSDSEIVNLEYSSNSPTQEKVVTKRRSSIFKRQSLVPVDQDLETTNITEEVSHESKKFKAHNEHELKSFDIQKYIDSLKKEDKCWRNEYLKRKSRTQEFLKRDKNHDYVQTIDYSCLSDSERAFLSTKPDYDEFNKNLFQLHTMATKVVYLNLCAENLCNKSSSKLQNDLDKAKYRIMSLVD